MQNMNFRDNGMVKKQFFQKTVLNGHGGQQSHIVPCQSHTVSQNIACHVTKLFSTSC